jgi:hypothetical protein
MRLSAREWATLGQNEPEMSQKNRQKFCANLPGVSFGKPPFVLRRLFRTNSLQKYA